LHNGEPSWEPEVVASYVLSAPSGDDKKALDDAVRLAADAVEAIIAEGAEAAGNRFNRK
jgi:PTH1 family peptidyl-tRNA hydrolase